MGNMGFERKVRRHLGTIRLNGQNWETETVSLEGDGERPGKRYRENAAGWKSVSV